MTSPNRSPNPAESLFWDLIDELREHDGRVEEGTIMGARCARVSGEFLGLVDYKGSGMVVKLPRDRGDALIAQGIGQPFAPTGKGAPADWGPVHFDHDDIVRVQKPIQASPIRTCALNANGLQRAKGVHPRQQLPIPSSSNPD